MDSIKTAEPLDLLMEALSNFSDEEKQVMQENWSGDGVNGFYFENLSPELSAKIVALREFTDAFKRIKKEDIQFLYHKGKLHMNLGAWRYLQMVGLIHIN